MSTRPAFWWITIFTLVMILSLLDYSLEATPITYPPLMPPTLGPYSLQSSWVTDSDEHSPTGGKLSSQFHISQPKGAQTQLYSLEKEIMDFEEKYQVLTDDVLSGFKRRKVSHYKIQSYLRQLPVSLKLQCSEFFLNRASHLTRANSVEELFLILSMHWDFMNPNLLARLAYRFGDDQTRSLVDKYMEELKGFRMRTKVKDFVNQWTGRPIPDFHKIAVVLKDNWKEYSLEELEVFRIELSHQRWLEEGVLRFDGTQDACVAAIFSLPKAIDSYQLDLESLRDFFQQHQILRVFLNGVCIIDLQVYPLLIVFSVDSEEV